jgi:hypothetical protein
MKNALDIFLASVVAVFASAFIYGFVTYPDAPIRRCGDNQFCGKWNKLHTEREFKEFGLWETALLGSFAFAVVAGGLLARRRRRGACRDLEHLRAIQRDLPPAIEEQRYAAAWKERRGRKLAAAALCLLALSSVGWAADSGVPAAPLQMVLMALAVGSCFWFFLFRCPRCGHQFLNRQSEGRCHFCGLRLGTTFEDSVVEFSESKE